LARAIVQTNVTISGVVGKTEADINQTHRNDEVTLSPRNQIETTTEPLYYDDYDSDLQATDNHVETTTQDTNHEPLMSVGLQAKRLIVLDADENIGSCCK
jgi:hypothetical protein